MSIFSKAAFRTDRIILPDNYYILLKNQRSIKTFLIYVNYFKHYHEHGSQSQCILLF